MFIFQEWSPVGPSPNIQDLAILVSPFSWRVVAAVRVSVLHAVVLGSKIFNPVPGIYPGTQYQYQRHTNSRPHDQHNSS